MADNSTNRRRFIKAAAATGIVGAAGCLGDDNGDDADDDGHVGTWSLGTSSEGSSSFRIGSVWSEYASREDALDLVDVEAIVTEGTGATYRRVDAGELELGGSTTQLLDDSPDQGPYEETALEDFEAIRQIRGYMGFFNFGLYNADEVGGWDDLEGAPIAISSAGSGTRPPVEWVVDQVLGLDNVDNRYMAFADIPAALRGGTVDAAFTWTVNETTPQGWFEEIDATVDWEPLPIPDDVITQLEDDLPYSTYVELDEDTVAEFSDHYEGSLDTFTLTYTYVGKDELDDDVVYEIAEFTHESGDELVEEDPVMGFFPDPDQFLGTIHPDVPVHQGAYEYYQDAGLWDDYDLTPPPEA